MLPCKICSKLLRFKCAALQYFFCINKIFLSGYLNVENNTILIYCMSKSIVQLLWVYLNILDYIEYLFELEYSTKELYF